jgi:hypothetical protein
VYRQVNESGVAVTETVAGISNPDDCDIGVP